VYGTYHFVLRRALLVLASAAPPGHHVLRNMPAVIQLELAARSAGVVIGSWQKAVRV